MFSYTSPAKIYRQENDIVADCVRSPFETLLCLILQFMCENLHLNVISFRYGLQRAHIANHIYTNNRNAVGKQQFLGRYLSTGQEDISKA